MLCAIDIDSETLFRYCTIMLIKTDTFAYYFYYFTCDIAGRSADAYCAEKMG